MKISRKTKRLLHRTALVGAGLYIAFTMGVQLTNWITGLIQTTQHANASCKTDVKAFSSCHLPMMSMELISQNTRKRMTGSR
jgi:hypothetical protein